MNTQRIYTENSFENHQEPQRARAQIPFVETDFAESEDGSLIEMIEDPENSSRSLLAVWKDGEVRITDRFRCRDRILVAIPRDQHIVKHVRFPQGVESCISVETALAKIESIFVECLDLSGHDICLLSVFVLSTWFIEQLPVAPYVALVGLPRSGKSTALSVLRLLCRRALLTADITSAAFYRACERLTPTLLIDEAGTAGEERTLLHLLRTGTTRDVIALRKDQSFNTFGAKVVSWTDLPDDAALNSRCVIIPLKESHRTDLKKPSSPEIVQAADALQKRLLQLRFAKYKKLSLPKIPGHEKLYSRTRDLYTAFALPVAELTKTCEWLVKIFTSQQESGREPLSPSQAFLLQFLFYAIHFHSRPADLTIKNLASDLNRFIRKAGEPFQMKPREVGAVLSSLGFTKRKRTNVGYELSLGLGTQKHIHRLIDVYGIDNNAGMPTSERRASCIFCKELDEQKGPAKQLVPQPSETLRHNSADRSSPQH